MPRLLIYGLCLILFLGSGQLFAGHVPPDRPPLKPFINLSGTWKFSIGDRPAWRDQSFPDADWESIRVPSSWEDQGFHGYNGYAWYRKAFRVPEDLGDQALMLLLGYIDDADEVYLNGQLIGSSGSFPPYFQTAFEQERRYPLRHDQLFKGEINVLAVRVYDGRLGGGIMHGEVGIFQIKNEKEPDLNLAGQWMFHQGDMRSVPTPRDFRGVPIIVPGYWESQGAGDYNGYAWYQKTFCLPPDLREKKLVLILGKIDDTDMVFVNGRQVGATGLTWQGPMERKDSQSWQKMRTYLIPQNLLNSEGNNVISIRVHDWIGDGGIYAGPVGLVRQERLVRFLRG